MQKIELILIWVTFQLSLNIITYIIESPCIASYIAQL